MKEIKKIFVVILILSVVLFGCSNSKTSSQNIQENKLVLPTNSVSEISSDTKTSEKMTTAVLYTGIQYREFEEYSYQYSDPVSAEVLGEELCELTGLNFFFTSTSKSDGIVIDWNANSGLFVMSDTKKMSLFFGYDSLPDGPSGHWFMLDSLWKTLAENLDVENIYYTMNGGKELKIDGLRNGTILISEFPSDIAYMGSSFCSVHTDGNYKVCKEFNQDTAMEMVQQTIHCMGKKASVIVQTGEEIIEGEQAFTYSAGENSVDGQKYTALYHYAITDSGKIYYMDILQGEDWILFQW